MSGGRRHAGQRGFSVIEALVSMVVFLGLLTAAMSIYAPSRIIHKRGALRADVQQNARLAMAEMSRQIRMAGYFPENFADPPAAPLVADPIVLATSAAVAIHGDADGSSASNVFLFCLDGTVLRRGRGAVDDIASYTCGDGEILAESVVELTFTYYDVDGNPVPDPPAAPFALDGEGVGAVPDLSDTSQRASIRRVVMTLTAEAESPQRGPQTYSLASDVWLRNSG